MDESVRSQMLFDILQEMCSIFSNTSAKKEFRCFASAEELGSHLTRSVAQKRSSLFFDTCSGAKVVLKFLYLLLYFLSFVLLCSSFKSALTNDNEAFPWFGRSFIPTTNCRCCRRTCLQHPRIFVSTRLWQSRISNL